MEGPGAVGQVPVVHVPVMTPERFCELTGVSEGVLLGWMNRGYVPVVIIGRHRLVNLTKLASKCASSETEIGG